MAYYSAALAFSPLGAPRASTGWGASIGLEASYVPPLSAAQRSAGFSRTESTNLLGVIPRPRLGMTAPGGVGVEMSWIPPIAVSGVKANLFSAAVTRSFTAGRGIVVTPRIAGTVGSVRAPITCNDDLLDGGEGNTLFFAHVCHDMESEDRFEPAAASAEIVASRPLRIQSVVPYAGAGVRVERDRFVVGVRNTDGSFDPNHPILELDLTRPYGFLGATWDGPRRSALSGELFYAPRSLLTVRVQVSLRLVGGR